MQASLTNDVTTDLSHIFTFVIARNTAMTCKGKAADMKAIGHEALSCPFAISDAELFVVVAGAMVPSERGAPGAVGFLDGSKASPRPPFARFRVTAADVERSAAERRQGTPRSRVQWDRPVRLL
jgi:hypothetical protein